MLFVLNRDNDSRTRDSYFQDNERLTIRGNHGRTSKYRKTDYIYDRAYTHQID